MDSIKSAAEQDISNITEFLSNPLNKTAFISIFNECSLLLSSSNKEPSAYPVLHSLPESSVQYFESTLRYLSLCLKYNADNCTSLLPLSESEKEEIKKCYDELLVRKEYINSMHYEDIEAKKPKSEKIYPTDCSISDSYLSNPFGQIVDIKWRMLMEVANTYYESAPTPYLLVTLIILKNGELQNRNIVCGENELEHWINILMDAITAVDYKLK